MNQRERILAAAIGGLAVLFVLVWGYQRVGGWFELRRTRLANAEKQVRDKQVLVDAGLRASSRLAEFEERSLPSNPEVARSVYQQWLLDHLRAAGMQEVKVTAAPTTTRATAYTPISFTLTARGDLQQTTNLLYDLSAAALVQRIRQLNLKPIRDSKLLDVTLTIEAISLPGGPATGPIPPADGWRLARGDRDNYLTPIINRNLFGPPNRPPRLSAISRQQTNPGRALSVAIRADDPDKLDRVRYTLVEGATSATLDPASGQFRFTPRAKGEFEFVVRATDDGFPARSDERKFSVAVVDPPPPPPPPPTPTPRGPELRKEADLAMRFAVLSAVIEAADGPQAWIAVRTTGQVLKLAPGDRFEVGAFRGRVEDILPTTVELSEADGRRWLISLGENLGEAREIPADGL